MRDNSHKMRFVLSAMAAGALASASAFGATGSYGLLPRASDESAGPHLVLNMTPLPADPLAPTLGVGPYGLGFAGSPDTWRSGFDEWEARALREQLAVTGLSIAPAVAYRASTSLALDAGVDLRYRLAPSAGSQLPASLQDPAYRAGLRGADLSLGLRYALDPGTEIGLAYRSRFKDDTLHQGYPVTRYSDLAVPGVQVPGVTVPQAVAATLSRQFGERWALTGALGWQELAQTEGSAFSQSATLQGGDAWFAGVGARYALRENLGVGMSVEYLYGSGLDPARRNLVPSASPTGDGSYYFFGLDLNWRF